MNGADTLVRALIEGAVKASLHEEQSGNFYAAIVVAADAIYTAFEDDKEF